MARSENQKLKLLYLRELFSERGDEAHPLTMGEILAALKEKGIACERKSIYDDIDNLIDYGMDIVLQRGRGGGYYLASRDFEVPELKLLVDAVQSSRFLTTKKSLELIKKLERLAGHTGSLELHQNVVVSNRVKNMDETIYYAVDAINEAIAQNRKITFRYFDWNLKKERQFRDRKYEASPYALVWNNEFYYLVAHSERHGITHYRVDHMAGIRSVNEPRFLPDGKIPDLTIYGKSVFSMYSGKMTQVKLLFDNSLAGVALDRFGHASILVPEGETKFSITAPVAVSDTFFGWLTEFGGKIQVLYPQEVRDRYRQLLEDNLKQYQ